MLMQSYSRWLTQGKHAKMHEAQTLEKKFPECGFVCRAAGAPTGKLGLGGVKPAV